MGSSEQGRRRAIPWLVWFVIAFSLNATLDLGLGLSWWVRWPIVVATIPLAIVGWEAVRRRRHS